MALLIDQKLGFIKGNLHTHTTLSDGRLSVEAATARYAQKGYDFLAITDHDKQYRGGSPASPLLLDGVEFGYTYKGECVHIVGVGLNGTAEHGETPQDGVDSINHAGGVAVFAHPAWSLNSTAMLLGMRDVAAFEIYNSVSNPPANLERGYSGMLLDPAFAKGLKANLAATDDSHFYSGEECRGAVVLNTSLVTRESICECLRAGRYYSTQGPRILEMRFESGTLYIRTSPAAGIYIYSNLPWVTHRSVLGENITEYEYTMQEGETFLRAEVCDAHGLYAWSNPVFAE